MKGSGLMARGRSGLTSVQKEVVQAAIWKVASTNQLIWVCVKLNYHILKLVRETDILYNESVL